MNLLDHPTCETADAVLADAAAQRRVADDAERRILVRATQWADAHPADPESAFPFPGPVTKQTDPEDLMPQVDWDAAAEFALAVGMAPNAGEALMRDGLELRHRCPLTWDRVIRGNLSAWRARRIAQGTMGHPDEVAAHVDEHVAHVAHRVGILKLEKLIDEAMLVLFPAEREAERTAALDARQVRLLEQISANGVATIIIEADLKDALDFNDTITRLAGLLKDAGCEESLDVRRALAVGVLADPARALALLEGTEPPRPNRKRATLVVHISQDVVTTTHGCPDCRPADSQPVVARLERGARPVSVAMIRDWLGREDTALTVLPVIDDSEHQAVDRYEIPGRIRQQVARFTITCSFPFCERPATACDCDHNVPFGKGGRTCTCNLAATCRRHHRLKTFGGWSYTIIDPGAHLWRSPGGRHYFRDALGTVDVTLPGEVEDHSGCFHDEDSAERDRPPPRPGRWREREAQVTYARGTPCFAPDDWEPDPNDLVDDTDLVPPSTGRRRQVQPDPDEPPPF
ncbi:MAG TPA: HNH endonuclease signature motif containing protein [Nocardioides sp.]